MSTHAAIAAVTATLHVRLRNALQATALNADVSHTRPGTTNAFPNKVGVHLFLYMVTPNAALRSVDLATRDERGRIACRPTAALDLHYLLSFFGDDLQHEPQRMLGAVVVELHAHPLLALDEIRSATAGTVVAGSLLEQQIERVRLTPEAINLEEFSKLWSVFFQTQYLLSVAYKASLVLLEAEVATPVAGRVRSRGVFTAPLPPSITSLSPQILSAGGQIVLRGSSLRGASTKVRLVREDGSTRDVDPAFLLDDRLEVVLPVDLRAGIASILVVTSHEASSGPLPPRTFELESGPAEFMLAPRVVATVAPLPTDSLTLGEVVAAAGSVVILLVVPPIAADQDVHVIVGSVRVQPTVLPDAVGTRRSMRGKSSRVRFVVPTDPALEAGRSYPLRVEVDGAVSLVEPDGSNFKPRLTLPGGP